MFLGARASFVQQWKTLWTIDGVLLPLVSSLGMAIIVAWIAGGGGNQAAPAYLIVGGTLAQLWAWGVWRTAYALTYEHFQGTLELMLVTATPLHEIVIGKMGAVLVFAALLAAPVALATSTALRSVTELGDLPLFATASLLALVSVVSLCFLFVPLAVATAERYGYQNALLPFLGLLNGFTFPPHLLPPPVDMVAFALPTAWSMRALLMVIEGASLQDVAGPLAVAAALIAFYALCAVKLTALVSRRLRR